MDKRITLAVAGSGKTTRIVNSIDINCKTLILTFTHANTDNIKRKVIRKFGRIPDSVKISPFTSFLYTSCFRPLFHDQANERGLTFKEPARSYSKKTDIEYYLNPKRLVYHSRMSLAFTALDQINDLLNRLERFYDHIFIDEFQDLAGRDFDFLTILSQSKLKVDLVGDFFQHTYPSSRDGNYNSGLFDDRDTYLKRLKDAGYSLHPEQLTNSYRCSPTVCGFVKNSLGIEIESHRSDQTSITYVEDPIIGAELRRDDSMVKLFYQDHSSYNCFSKNWGECKGEDDYHSVCVVLNKTTDGLYRKSQLKTMASISKNKFYVALTRARGDVFLISPECFS